MTLEAITIVLTDLETGQRRGASTLDAALRDLL